MTRRGTAPEATAALLWAAARPTPDVDGVRAAIQDGADLALAAELALAQRVAPLVHRAVSEAVPESRDAHWVRLLEADATRCRAQALIVRPRLADTVFEPLAAAGIEPLVFKGAALVDRYPAPGLRPMDDVDVILPAEQHPAALAVLETAGWRALPPTPGAHHEVPLSHPALPGLPLELHLAFATWRERSSDVNTDDLWRNRRPLDIAGAPAFGLDAEHELIAVAAHAARPTNVFRRLIWSVDLVVIIDRASAAGDPVDWTQVEALADEARCRTAVAVGLAHAQRLGAESPAHLRRLAATGTRNAALAPVLEHQWPSIEYDVSMRHRLGYALMDDRRHQMTFFVGAATDGGLARTPFRAAAMGGRALRRWWQLRSGGDTAA